MLVKRYGMEPKHSLEGKILCILLNVHTLMSLFRILPTGISCWWALSYCLRTTLILNEPAPSKIWLVCALANLWHTPLTVWQLPVHMWVFLSVMWDDNGPVGVLLLAEKLHFMNAQWTSFIKFWDFFFSLKTHIEQRKWFLLCPR